MLNDESSKLKLSSKKVLDSVLILSVRNFRAQASNCTLYEFEDFIAQVADTKIVCPQNEQSGHRKIYRLSKYLTNSDSLSARLSQFRTVATVEEDYDVILVVADNPWQLHLLNQVAGWQHHSAKKVCYITEFWPSELKRWRLKKEPFKNFDHIFLGLSNGVASLQDQVDRPCTFIPLGVNTDVFSSESPAQHRTIDINYVGRRRSDIHHALVNSPDIKDYFYYFDTAKNQKLFVDNHKEHRYMYAQLLRRSVFSFAFPAKSNLLAVTGGVEEIGGRYYELAASGTVIIGETPNNAHFKTYFGWQDAVIPMPANASKTLSYLAELQADTARISNASRRNIVNSLRTNDWAYRWQTISETLGYSPSQLLRDKIDALSHRANLIENRKASAGDPPEVQERLTEEFSVN